jgi:hypothetical protein
MRMSVDVEPALDLPVDLLTGLQQRSKGSLLIVCSRTAGPYSVTSVDFVAEVACRFAGGPRGVMIRGVYLSFEHALSQVMEDWLLYR